jgi:deoxyribodipyrimidine photo-lyase
MDLDIAHRAGPYRNAFLSDSLLALDISLGGRLAVINGDPVSVLHDVIERYGITSIHVSQEFAPYGVARDMAIAAAGIVLNQVGSSYAVAPGRIRKSDGTNYRVFTPFYRAWQAHGWRLPVAAPVNHTFVEPHTVDRQFPNWKPLVGVILQEAGEEAALNRWNSFKNEELAKYDQARNIPGIPGTSRLSPHLRWGQIHPRTILAGLNGTRAHDVFRKEIAWREFYADVLHHYPHTSRDYYLPKFATMRYNSPGSLFTAWCEGKTGYPIVDAGMRQLRAEGWMHNRVRMVVASFLVKDLHVEWQHGANYFMKYLIDNEVASNSHGWQWTAGCGTDASPYYRIFNPVEQGKRFDDNGDYIRKYVPELAHLPGTKIHQPWNSPVGYMHGYCERIVDHATERLESLARLQEMRGEKDE